ncbi:MAG: hypothetical protein OJF61_002641 [Rhodanobacteraceae bacterium]|nr:MAG: hypothetical protein OJF61_002641 [Rhodanobacteraceae bacterium]
MSGSTGCLRPRRAASTHEAGAYRNDTPRPPSERLHRCRKCFPGMASTVQAGCRIAP